MKKNIFRTFIFVVLIVGTMLFNACATVNFDNMGFWPYARFDGEGYLINYYINGAIGSFSFYQKSYSDVQWKFLLVQGSGDTDNGLFEIYGSNTLRVKETLPAGTYSVRVKTLKPDQDENRNGFQKSFTITIKEVTRESCDPELVGTWAMTTYTEMINSTLVITSYREFASNGTINTGSIIGSGGDFSSHLSPAPYLTWFTNDGIITFIDMRSGRKWTAEYSISGSTLTISESHSFDIYLSNGDWTKQP